MTVLNFSAERVKLSELYELKCIQLEDERWRQSVAGGKCVSPHNKYVFALLNGIWIIAIYSLQENSISPLKIDGKEICYQLSNLKQVPCTIWTSISTIFALLTLYLREQHTYIVRRTQLDIMFPFFATFYLYSPKTSTLWWDPLIEYMCLNRKFMRKTICYEITLNHGCSCMLALFVPLIRECRIITSVAKL